VLFLIVNCLVGNIMGLDFPAVYYEAINKKTLNIEAVFSSETLVATCCNTPCRIDTETSNTPKVFEFSLFQFLRDSSGIFFTCLLVRYHYHILSKMIVEFDYVLSTFLIAPLNNTVEIN